MVALLTPALGIGANTVMFSVVRAVILKPLPFREPARLAAVWDSYLPAFPNLGLLPVELDALAGQSDLFEETAWYRYIPYNLRLIQPDLPAVELRATVASPRLFELLGVPPAIGQGLSTGSVMLSHRIWMSRFNGDHNVTGRVIRLGEGTFTVTGVMPGDFNFPEATDVWLAPGPLLGDELTNPLRHAIGLVARLRPVVSIALKQARASSRSSGSWRKTIRRPASPSRQPSKACKTTSRLHNGRCCFCCGPQSARSR